MEEEKILEQIALCFDDVLIRPDYSEVTKHDIDLTPKPIGPLQPSMPIISSCMDTVTELYMARAMHDLGGIGIYHRYDDLDRFKEIIDISDTIPIAIGTWKSHEKTIRGIIERGAKILVIDVAHGASKYAIETIKKVKELNPNIIVISGNVATAHCAKLVSLAGADGMRVGIGGGSACTTRIQTGCGLPTLASILEIRAALPDALLFADGGIRNSGDIAKAIGAGADYVILGGLLAGTQESPGRLYHRYYMFTKEHYTPLDEVTRDTGSLSTVPTDWSDEQNREYRDTLLEEGTSIFKRYRGMASYEAMVENNNKSPDKVTEEGESYYVPYKGSVRPIVAGLLKGLKQAMHYVGAKNLKEFYENVFFQPISDGGRQEGPAHGKSKSHNVI